MSEFVPTAAAVYRGVVARATIEDYPDDHRYVKVTLYVDPRPGGIDSEAYSVLVKTIHPHQGSRKTDVTSEPIA